MRADVLVIGGGPAGTSCAIALARAGRSVVVLERSHYERTRVGETLPPLIRRQLGELGVWPQFIADKHIPSAGILSVWGNSEVFETDFILNPYGSGWHIDRCRFDKMLAAAAEDAGAVVLRSATVASFIPQPSNDWVINAKCDKESFTLRANFLVNATGRGGLATSGARKERIFYDKLIGLVKLLPVRSADLQEDSRALVEATENGWWYSAFLPQDLLIAAYMTDADQIPTGGINRAKAWQQQLEKAPHTYRRVATCAQNAELKIVAANSYRRAAIIEVNSLMIGDAAVAFDPLSGQGICHALDSGLAAAAAIVKHQQGQSDALANYEHYVLEGFADYLRARTDHYEREKRWPESAFWKRRRSPQRMNAEG